MTYATGRHTLKGGFEARLNRDTTYFGISPNGEYDFGGGTAYATEAIPSESGTHDIHPGDPLPDTLSSFSLRQSLCLYDRHCATLLFERGTHRPGSDQSRITVSFFVQDTFKVNSRLTLDYGVRWDLYTPISERAHRTSTIVTTYGTRSSTSSIRSPVTRPTGTPGSRASRSRGR